MGAREPTRRQVLQTAAGLAVARPAAACRGVPPGGAPPRPNVLWIVADQHRADVGGFAGDRAASTPELDALAAGGTAVSDVYCQVPLCVPSRQSLVTARYAHRHGAFLNAERKLGQRTVVHALRDAGYHTALVGRAHCDTSGYDVSFNTPSLWRAFRDAHPDGKEPGWEHHTHDRLGRRDVEKVRAMNPDYAGPGEGTLFFMEEVVARESARILRERPTDRPFFLWSSFQSPHPPLFPPQEWLDLFADADVPVRNADMARQEPGLFELHARRRKTLGYAAVDATALRNITRAYYASLAWADHCAGRILRALEEEGLADDTIVVYTSDHGELLGEHGLMAKRALFEGALRVPLLVRWPGRIPAGGRLETVVQHVDAVATILDLAGVRAPDLDGRSFAGLLRREATDWDPIAVAEMLGGAGAEQEGEGPPPRFCWMLRSGRHKYVQHSVTEQALYDLEEDPGETRDLSGEPGKAELVAEMRARLTAIAPRPWKVDAASAKGGRGPGSEDDGD